MNETTLQFDGTPVPVIEDTTGGRRRRLITLAAVAEVTGMERETLRNIIKRNADVFDGLVLSVTVTDNLGRPRETTVLTRDGAMALLLKINTNQIENEERRQRIIRFQRWAAEVLGEVVETGTYIAPGAAPSQAQLALVMAQALVEHERRLNEVAARVAAIEARQQEAEQQLQALPEPTAPPADITKRALLNRLIRAYAIQTGVPVNVVWDRLYMEFRDRYHIDLKARATHRKGPLDVAEELGHIETLYNLACHLFRRAS